LLNSILRLFVGNKSERDIQNALPIVEKIKEFEQKLSQESTNGLRAATNRLKAVITDSIKDFEQQIQDKQHELDENESLSFEEREKFYDEIDALKKQIDSQIETTLQEILPEAFAIVKETAKRFTEQTTIEVEATDFDRDLAA